MVEDARNHAREAEAATKDIGKATDRRSPGRDCPRRGA